METIITLLVLGILVCAVACTPTKKTAEFEETATDAVEAAVEAVEKAVEEVTEEAEENVGGACFYKSIEGTATITFLNTANTAEVVIKFDFTPNQNNVDYTYPNFPDTNQRFFVKGQGCCPPLDWCKKNGIKQGAKIKCVRSEVTKGSCTPVVFSFPQFEKKGWN